MSTLIGKQIREDSLYNLLKAVDPDGVEQVPFPKPIVDFVDNCLEMKRRFGVGDSLDTQASWRLAEFIYKGFVALYPKSASDFENKMGEWKQKTGTGVIKHKGGGMMQHQLEIPRPLYQLLKVMFPDQVWDKKFIASLAKNLPQLKVIKGQL